MAYRTLPVSDLPTVDFPTIQVNAGLPGASPETMASSVALPLEKQFAAIAGLTNINSTSPQGIDQHHAAVRFEPQHRRGRPGRAGDDRPRVRALPPQMPAPPSYQKGQSGRPVGHPARAAVGHAAVVDDRRIRAADHRPAHLDGERRGAGRRVRLAEVRRPHRRRPARARGALDRHRRGRQRGRHRQLRTCRPAPSTARRPSSSRPTVS